MSCNCCSFVVVKAGLLAAQAESCLRQVNAQLEQRQQELNQQAKDALIRRKNRWYYFGTNENYVPTEQEIAGERAREYPWYHVLYGIPVYNDYNLMLQVKKETAQRLLAAANIGETVSVSTEDIRTIS